jgi:hypothetical protein
MELVRLGFVAKHGASRLLLCSGKAPPSLTFLRLIGQESRAGVGRRLGRRNLKEVTAEVGQAVSAPAGETGEMGPVKS